MSYRIPYNQLPNLGTLQEFDIVPGLRPAFEEGSMTVGDLTNFVTPYKVYRADMTQVAATDPTVDYIYENRIGSIVWTYDTIGSYIGTLTGGFLGYVPQTSRVFFTSGGVSVCYYTIYKIDDDNIRIKTIDKTFLDSDDLLKTTFVEIFVYP